MEVKKQTKLVDFDSFKKKNDLVTISYQFWGLTAGPVAEVHNINYIVCRQIIFVFSQLK